MGIYISLWPKQLKKKKLIILPFDKYYLESIYNYISGNEKLIEESKLSQIDKIGFEQDNIQYKDFDFNIWYLTPKNRHLWKHHYSGSNGIILVFSFPNEEEDPDPNLVIEVMNIFFEKSTLQTPILILFDLAHQKLQKELKESLKESEFVEKEKYYIQSLVFDTPILNIKNGLDWLCNKMSLVK